MWLEALSAIIVFMSLLLQYSCKHTIMASDFVLTDGNTYYMYRIEINLIKFSHDTKGCYLMVSTYQNTATGVKPQYYGELNLGEELPKLIIPADKIYYGGVVPINSTVKLPMLQVKSFCKDHRKSGFVSFVQITADWEVYFSEQLLYFWPKIGFPCRF